jgi:hypothetical protein
MPLQGLAELERLSFLGKVSTPSMVSQLPPGPLSTAASQPLLLPKGHHAPPHLCTLGLFFLIPFPKHREPLILTGELEGAHVASVLVSARLRWAARTKVPTPQWFMTRKIVTHEVGLGSVQVCITRDSG